MKIDAHEEKYFQSILNITTANPEAPLNICNTIYRAKDKYIYVNDNVEALHYAWYQILNHFYRGHFIVVSLLSDNKLKYLYSNN